jgi:hypothetical protein
MNHEPLLTALAGLEAFEREHLRQELERQYEAFLRLEDELVAEALERQEAEELVFAP